MMPKRLESFNAATAIILLAIGSSDIARTQTQQSLSDDRASLAWHVRQARMSGKTSITLSTPDALWAQPEPLDEALDHTSLTLAKLVATATTHSDYDIYTWRKYRVMERLSSQPEVPQEPLTETVPAELLPLAADEFVVPELGGVIKIDGVTITMRNQEVLVPQGQNHHLMFVLFRCSGALGLPNYGPQGIFSVDESEAIHAWVDSDSNHMRSELLNRTGGKLAGLRALALNFTAKHARR